MTTAITLQEGDSSLDPIIFTYGIQGITVGREVTSKFRSHPVYAIQAPEYSRDIDIFTMKDRALFHLSEIKELKLERRLHLIGFSFGGPLAVLIALLMQDENLRFSLTLIDPVPFSHLHGDGFVWNIQTRRFWLGYISAELAEILSKREIKDEWNDDLAIFKALSHDEDLTETIRKHLSVIQRTGASMNNARDSYQSRLLCKCALLSIDHGNFFKPTRTELEEDYGWSSVIDGVETVQLQGDHYGFFHSRKSVSVLVEHLYSLFE